jgi:hypothetical protein
VEGQKTELWYTHQLTQDELKRFIADARAGKDDSKAWIGNIDPGTAKKIEALIKVQVSKIMLEGGSVRHSHKKAHHNLEEDDLLYAVDVINNAISIEISPQKHRDSDVLTFRGDINGEIYFLEAVRPKHEGWLSLVTCYRPRKAGQGSNAAETAPRS